MSVVVVVLWLVGIIASVGPAIAMAHVERRRRREAAERLFRREGDVLVARHIMA